jgi:putative membrane protein
MTRPFLIPFEDHSRISAAIEAAEALSDGEIGTMVARQSDDYTEWAALLCTAVAFAVPALLAVWPETYTDAISWITGGWVEQVTTTELLSATLGAQLLLFLLCWLLLRWQPLRVALTPARLKRHRVRDAAIRAFRIGIEARTRAATGVLIYLSIAEHRAEIVADSAITDRVGAEEWGDAMAVLIAEVKADRPGNGIVEAVKMAGALLARHFPRSDDDRNELPDRVIEL